MSAKRSLSHRPKYGSSEKKLTALDAAELVLRKFAKRKPMHCQDIVERAMREGWLTSKAARPEAPGWQLLFRAQKDIKKREEQGASARFTNPTSGCLGLAEWGHRNTPRTHSEKTAGVVYVLSNKAMEGLLKIGVTEDLEQRMKHLYNTSIPTRFDCVCAIRVDDAKGIEKDLHRLLKGSRVNPDREFFRLDAEDIVPHLTRLGVDVTPASNSLSAPDTEMTPTEVTHERRARRILQRTRGPSLRLSELGILPGEILSANRRGSHEKCIFVRGDFRDDIVKFRDKETTFTKATKQLLGNPTWQPRPARHWRYKERPLEDIYKEKYSAMKRQK